MSDFHIAIPEAVTHVQPLVQALDDAVRECHEAVRYLEALGERLARDGQELEAAAVALELHAEQAEQQLVGQADDAAANLGRVKEVVDLASWELQQMVADEQQALDAAAELLPDMAEQVKELGDRAQTLCESTLEWVTTVSQQLEEAVASVERAVGEGLPASMAMWKMAVEAQVAHVVEFLTTGSREQLQVKRQDWDQKLEQVLEVLDRAFAGIEQHDEEVAKYTAEQWDHLFEVQLEKAEKKAGALAGNLSTLSQSVEMNDRELQAAGEEVRGQQGQAAERARRLEGGLEALRSRWASFGVIG